MGRNGREIITVFAGALFGAACAIVLAPASGRQTRRVVTDALARVPSHVGLRQGVAATPATANRTG